MLLALLEDREGTIWAGGVRFHRETLRDSELAASSAIGEDGSFGYGVFSLV